MKKILLGLATVTVVLGISLSACGSSDPCTGTSKCSADPAPTADTIKACQDAAAKITTCKTEYNAFASCTQANQVCGSDNKTDGVKTLAACQTQYDAYTKCITSSVTDAGTGGKDGG